jgi:YbgC/YbaW family acyl-CoA thioester hydrolase
MAATFTAQRRVEFHETDMAGIVHFSNFFRYMEEAEVEFLRTLGLGVQWHSEGKKFGFPRVAASCEFFRPVRFQDQIEIHVAVEQIGCKSVTWAHEIRRGAEVLARGKITTVCCLTTGEKMESVEIPAEIRKKLETA